MSNPIGQYTFRVADNKLKFHPRTLNDLENRAHFDRAAEAAQALKSEVHDTYLDMLALDQSEHDLNKRSGEVLLRDHPLSSGRVSGHAFALKALERSGGQVMKVGIESEGSRAEIQYTLEPERDFTAAHRVIDRDTSAQVRESVISGSYVREGVTEYEVSAGPDAAPHFKALTNAPYALDKTVSFPRETVSKSFASLEEDRLDFQPRTLGDLNEIEGRRELIALGNQARDLVLSVYEGVRALDGTSADLNPKRGEVLFKEVEIEGRTLSGFLSEYQVNEGYTRERTHGDTAPYLEASSPASNERFTAVLPGESPSEPGYKSESDTLLTYENGSQEVQVTLSRPYYGESIGAQISLGKLPTPKAEPKSWWERIFG